MDLRDFTPNNRCTPSYRRPDYLRDRMPKLKLELMLQMPGYVCFTLVVL